MNKTFNLLLSQKSRKSTLQGEVPYYIENYTLMVKVSELVQNVLVLSSKWNSQAQSVKGSSEECKSLNFYLKTFEQKVCNTYHQINKGWRAGKQRAPLRNKLLGKIRRIEMLIPIFKDHNCRMEKLVGKEFAKGTLTRYKTCLSHTKGILEWKYNISDIDIRNINYALLNDF